MPPYEPACIDDFNMTSPGAKQFHANGTGNQYILTVTSEVTLLE
jgi:hypothetical protein